MNYDMNLNLNKNYLNKYNARNKTKNNKYKIKIFINNIYNTT